MWDGGFESCVNPEGYKAVPASIRSLLGFESCVNPEGYKAPFAAVGRQGCLRAV